MDTSPTAMVTRRIDALRIELGFSEVQLSQDSRIPLTTLKRRLKGDNKITLEELHSISGALGVSVTYWTETPAMAAA